MLVLIYSKSKLQSPTLFMSATSDLLKISPCLYYSRPPESLTHFDPRFYHIDKLLALRCRLWLTYYHARTAG